MIITSSSIGRRGTSVVCLDLPLSFKFKFRGFDTNEDFDNWPDGIINPDVGTTVFLLFLNIFSVFFSALKSVH